MSNWKINEVFNSMSGEYSIFGQGRNTTFVRASGCITECKYCDTDHRSHLFINNDQVKDMIAEHYYKTKHILLTGGEPLLQPELVQHVITTYQNCWIETSGLVPFKNWIGNVPLVVDRKFMDSVNHTGRENWDLIDDYKALGPHDCIKFVISEYHEIFKAKNFYENLENRKVVVAFSANYDKVSPRTLYEWLKTEFTFPFVLNVQLHKIINVK